MSLTQILNSDDSPMNVDELYQSVNTGSGHLTIEKRAVCTCLSPDTTQNQGVFLLFVSQAPEFLLDRKSAAAINKYT
jgi:hypothetical protein